MGDMGDIFNAMREDSKIRRSHNSKNSMRLLKESGFKFQLLSENGPHVRIGCFDFWASTGLFCSRDGKSKGRGVLNLLRELRRNANM